MENNLKLNFNIKEFKTPIYTIPDFTNKLIDLNESFIEFTPIINEKYFLWVESLKEIFKTKKWKVEKPFFQEIITYCGHIGNTLDCDEFLTFLKFTTIAIILDDLVFEKINSLKINSKERDLLINSLTIEKYKDNSIFGSNYWEILNQFKKYTHLYSFNRIKNSNTLWIKSTIENNNNCSINSDYSFNEYFQKRSSDVSGDFILTMCMLGIKDQYIEDSIFNSKHFQIINFHAKSFYILVNDLYSFKREINENDLLNYVKILAIQLNSIQMSIEKVIELIVYHYNQFLLSIETILKLYEKEEQTYKLLKKVFQIVKKTISGIYFAHKRCKRYN
ncbi:hypothetical protein RB653_002980 [Dictyostelium firmibasis]|uniref:Terpene synthase n=1 Tax=Dictyostelium firmibasis TaxID=79012 RepID=A0AAN7YZ51_9MYCE